MCDHNNFSIILSLICVIHSFQLTSSSSKPYDKTIHHWDDVVNDKEARSTLKSLQEYQNASTLLLSSSILHFIELTHNFSNEKNSNKCVKTSLSALNYTVKVSSYKSFMLQAEVALKTANLLTNLLTINASRGESLQIPRLHENFYWSLVRVNVQSDPLIFASGIAFKPGAFAKTDHDINWPFAPFAFRDFAQNIQLIDLAHQNTTDANQPTRSNSQNNFNNNTVIGEWFWDHATSNYSALLSHWHKVTDNKLMGIDDGVWTSPYLDCGTANTWLITYTVPFYGSSLSNKMKTEFK